MARILIVDDDLDIIDSLRLILEGNGHEVLVKTDTERLNDEVRSTSPDLIILDVMFPEDFQAGFKAARRLHKDADLAHMPILVLSAVNQRSNLSLSFSESDISDDFMPVQGFLEKPVEPRVLLEKINEVLRGAASDHPA